MLGKMILLPVFAFTVFCFSACSPLLDVEPRETSDLSVNQLVKLREKATDPEGKYAGAKSYIMKYSLERAKPGTKEYYSQEVMFKAPDKMRTTSFKDGKAFKAVVFNGGRAWNIDILSGRSKKIPEGTGLELVKLFTAMATPGTDITKIFKHISIDMFYIENVKTYRLICQAADANIAPYIIYVDGKTYLTNKIETVMYAPDGREYLYTAETVSYVVSDNIKLAEKSIVYLLDQTEISRLLDFKLNPEIHDSQFLPPTPFTHKIQESIPPETKAGRNGSEVKRSLKPDKKTVSPKSADSSKVSCDVKPEVKFKIAEKE